MKISSFLDSFLSKDKPQEKTKGISDVFEVPNYGDKVAPPKLSSAYLTEMKGWVHSCVTTISDAVGSVEVKLYKYKTNGETKEVFTHPILDTLYKINNFTTKFDHFWLTQAYLEMTGECPWYLEKTNGVITGIFILRPDRLTILYDAQNLVGGYEYSISKNSLGKSRVILLKPDEIIFLKVPNPNNVYRGLGTLQAVARTINIDEFAETWNENFFYNSARPDSILMVKVKRMTDEQRNKLKATLKVNHKGLDNAHKTMVLSGDMEYKQVGFSQADMEFLEQQKFSRDKILGIFRVPKVLVAQTDGVNYANAKTSENIFAKYTIKPKLERIFSQLNEFLVPMYPDGDQLFLDFESPVKEDQEENIAKYNSGINNGYMTINEVREKENLAPIKGDVGNQVFLPAGMTPVGSTDKELIKPEEEEEVITEEETTEKISGEKLKAFKARTKKSRKLDNVRLQIRKAVKDSLIRKSTIPILEEKDVDPELEKKKLFWNTQIKTADKIEEVFIKGFKKIFSDQEKKVLRKLKQKAVNIDVDKVLLNEKVELAIGVKFATPELEKLIAEQGELAMSLVGDMDFDDKDTIIRKYLKTRPAKFVSDVTKVTNENIKKILEEGMASGASIDDITESIIEKFSFFKTSRATRIARTEVIRASNFATEQAYIQSGVVEQKEWLTAFDERTCARCEAMDGKRKTLGTNFFNKGDVFQEIPLDYEDIGFPPLHVSCRCTLIPVISEKSIKDNIEIKKKKEAKKQAEEIKKAIVSEAKKEVDKLKEEVNNSVDNIIKDTKKVNKKILDDSEQTKKSVEKSVEKSNEEKLQEDILADKTEMKDEIKSFKKVREEIQTIINEEDEK